MYFNPRSPHGERRGSQWGQPPWGRFQSTLPARGATLIRSAHMYISSHFNPRSPHGERPPPTPAATLPAIISIHAPRTGSDARCLLHGHRARAISIHAPRTGSDVVWHPQPCESYISIHAPRTGSDEVFFMLGDRLKISIHAPRTGSDAMDYVEYLTAKAISIHAPRTGSDASATCSCVLPCKISIHAPRTGSDPHRNQSYRANVHFNPRSPHGERLSW